MQVMLKKAHARTVQVSTVTHLFAHHWGHHFRTDAHQPKCASWMHGDMHNGTPACCIQVDCRSMHTPAPLPGHGWQAL
eukprot:scaffold98981_cov17-Tisochrysis_lutea.AAC.1